ncbi:MAG: YqaE/Pmp3 family membrane protein [Gammaproteobacteria bacterium]|nr:YqaE/Pmp3 family membrane protein [Gammaproteobacteria bacterium]
MSELTLWRKINNRYSQDAARPPQAMALLGFIPAIIHALYVILKH